MAGQSSASTNYGAKLFTQELSMDLQYQAQPLMRWVQFCDTDPAFGMHQGQIFLFDKVMNLDDEEGTIIPPGGDIPDTRGKVLQGQIQLDLRAKAVPYEEFLMRIAKFDITDINQRRFINSMAKTHNRAAATEFQATKVKYTPTGDQGNPNKVWDFDGTVSTQAQRNCSVIDIIWIIEAMKGGVYIDDSATTTIVPVPPYDDDGNYICICSVGFATALRMDEDFINAALYGDPERLFAGEIGRFHGVRFIEDNHILTSLLGTTAFKGEAIFFGAEAVKRAVALPAEIREDIPTELQTKRRAGWVSIEGYKIKWEYSSTTGEVENRIVHVTST